MAGHILVDLDATLSVYDGWKGVEKIGEPIPKMVERVKKWLQEGKDVRIFTARVNPNQDKAKLVSAKYWIQKWCLEYIGQELPLTCEKDFETITIWDDRCVQIIPNTGDRVDGQED
jgi:hypothetical protein